MTETAIHPTLSTGDASIVTVPGRSLCYVLITPARNEARFIEETIGCMIAQTLRPVKWVIVSDGSTDGTDEIVRRYTGDYPWIDLLRMPERTERHFAGKANAFNAGYSSIKDLNPDVIGNLDADVSFEPCHFEYLIGKFEEDEGLGVCGSPFREGDEQYDYRFSNIEHVSGACQLFRRECLEAIGGYRPLKGGCIDYVAVTTARMIGWKTRTFADRVCTHHRDMGTAQHGIAGARFKQGQKDFAVGYHPLWEAFRIVYQMRNKPYVLGALALAAAFLSSTILGGERVVTPELMAFTRQEQMTRLRRVLRFGRSG
jgi:glycosyltransferase involved in cell wall biosynthesis